MAWGHGYFWAHICAYAQYSVPCRARGALHDAAGHCIDATGPDAVSQNVFAVWHAESDGVMGVHVIYDVDLLPHDARKDRGVFVCVGCVDLSAEGAHLLAPLVVHEAKRPARIRVRLDVVMRTEYEIAEGVPRFDEVLWHGPGAHVYAGHLVPAGR